MKNEVEMKILTYIFNNEWSQSGCLHRLHPKDECLKVLISQLFPTFSNYSLLIYHISIADVSKYFTTSQTSQCFTTLICTCRKIQSAISFLSFYILYVNYNPLNWQKYIKNYVLDLLFPGCSLIWINKKTRKQEN